MELLTNSQVRYFVNPSAKQKIIIPLLLCAGIIAGTMLLQSNDTDPNLLVQPPYEKLIHWSRASSVEGLCRLAEDLQTAAWKSRIERATNRGTVAAMQINMQGWSKSEKDTVLLHVQESTGADMVCFDYSTAKPIFFIWKADEENLREAFLGSGPIGIGGGNAK